MDEKVVSLWIGNFNSESEMKEYFKVYYTEDADRVNSIFEDYFAIEDVEDDFRETTYYTEEKKSIKKLINGCSYYEQIIPSFVDTVTDSMTIAGNTVALLYGYDYLGEKNMDSGDGYTFQYIGKVVYKEA